MTRSPTRWVCGVRLLEFCFCARATNFAMCWQVRTLRLCSVPEEQRMSHFDEMTALLYLESQLNADHAQDVSTHAATCAECRELLHALETEGVWLRESLAGDEEAVPSRLIDAPEGHSAPWGWISALGLSAGGAYTLWSGFIEPWRAQAAQAGFTQGNLFTMLFFSGAFWKGWDAMRSLMEFLAVATLGLVVMWLLRRRWRSLTTITVVLGSMICSLAIPPVASAAETKHGDPNYTLPAGEEVKTDLIVFADRTQISGTVDGDLIVWSRRGIVTGHITGDILCFAQELTVNGPVDGNVRTFAQNATLSNKVGKNVMAWAQELDLTETASVGGSVTVGAGNAELIGHIAGDVLGFAESFGVTGSFCEPERASGKTAQAVVFGLLFLFATPIAAIILCVTIVGLGVGISTLFLYFIAIYSAQVFVGSWLGERILGSGVGVGAGLGRLALGLLLLRAIGMLPYVGHWISFLVVALGLGAMVLALYRYMRPQLAPSI